MNRCDNCLYSAWVRGKSLRLACLNRPYGADTVASNDRCPAWEAETQDKDVPPDPDPEPMKAHVPTSPKDDGSYEDDTYSLGTL